MPVVYGLKPKIKLVSNNGKVLNYPTHPRVKRYMDESRLVDLYYVLYVYFLA